NLVPPRTPQLRDRRKPCPPFALESVERLARRLLVERRVDRAQRGDDLFAKVPAHVAQRAANHVDDAGLDDGFGEGGLDGLGKAGEPVAANEKHVLEAAVLELREDVETEACSLDCRDQKPENHESSV